MYKLNVTLIQRDDANILDDARKVIDELKRVGWGDPVDGGFTYSQIGGCISMHLEPSIYDFRTYSTGDHLVMANNMLEVALTIFQELRVIVAITEISFTVKNGNTRSVREVMF